MRNRAKCRLCKSVVESFFDADVISCSCDEITVYGGEGMRCAAKNWANFIRLDDNDHEIIPTIKEAGQTETNQKKISSIEILDAVNEMIKRYDELPQGAMQSPVTQYDHYSLLLLIKSCLNSGSF